MGRMTIAERIAAKAQWLVTAGIFYITWSLCARA
jgi:hypothetical protein